MRGGYKKKKKKKIHSGRLKKNPYREEMLKTIYKKYWCVSVNKKKIYAEYISSVDFCDAMMMNELFLIVLFAIWLVNKINIAADTVTDLKIEYRFFFLH